jgi:hypothetical protein
MTPKDIEKVLESVLEFSEAIAKQVNEIEQRLKRLEEQPRQSLAAKLRAKK